MTKPKLVLLVQLTARERIHSKQVGTFKTKNISILETAHKSMRAVLKFEHMAGDLHRCNHQHFHSHHWAGGHDESKRVNKGNCLTGVEPIHIIKKRRGVEVERKRERGRGGGTRSRGECCVNGIVSTERERERGGGERGERSRGGEWCVDGIANRERKGGGGERTRSRGEWCVDGIANRERKGGGGGENQE